jgi:streptogramin lyase
MTVRSRDRDSQDIASLYDRLPIDQPTPAHLEEVHRTTGDCPDGLASGASGRLYLANLLSNQIVVLNPDGTEALRFPSAADNARQEIPYDQPSFLAFDGSGWLLVANAALTTPHSNHWAILKAFVNDAGLPLAEPSLP